MSILSSKIFKFKRISKLKLKFSPCALEPTCPCKHICVDCSYVDAYRNLTLKGISALRWLNQHCHKSYRIMKVNSNNKWQNNKYYSKDLWNSIYKEAFTFLIWLLADRRWHTPKSIQLDSLHERAIQGHYEWNHL